MRNLVAMLILTAIVAVLIMCDELRVSVLFAGTTDKTTVLTDSTSSKVHQKRAIFNIHDNSWFNFPSDISYRSNVSNDATYINDSFGSHFFRAYYCNQVYMTQCKAHAIRCEACANRANVVAGEEIFEYEDMWEASKRGGLFIEVGAGYGHWGVTYHNFCKVNHRSCFVIFIEPNEKGIQMIRDHVKLNGMEENSLVIQGMFSVNETKLSYTDPDGKMYGGVVRRNGESDSSATTLNSVMSKTKLTEINMIDMDIQGFEFDIFEDLMATNFSVNSIHIGTHGPTDRILSKVNPNKFSILRVYDRKPAERVTTPTEYGNIFFNDGVLTLKRTDADQMNKKN